MPPRQWEPLVAEFSDVMKLVHLAMRRDATDIASIANELFKEKRQAYEDGLTAQAANAGCAGRKGVMPNDILTMAHDEANSEAASIANTYNYDLAVAIRHIRTETPSANRHLYAKRLLEWEAVRDEWKSQQIALWNQTKWTNIAFQDFLAHNPQLKNGYAILQSKRTVCKICQYWASRGKVPLAEASRIEFPAHINCPHYWETHYKGKVNCEELWMGADVKQWWEDIEAGKELGEKGGPGSGNYGHSGRPGLVGGSGGEGGAMVGEELPEDANMYTVADWYRLPKMYDKTVSDLDGFGKGDTFEAAKAIGQEYDLQHFEHINNQWTHGADVSVKEDIAETLRSNQDLRALTLYDLWSNDKSDAPFEEWLNTPQRMYRVGGMSDVFMSFTRSLEASRSASREVGLMVIDIAPKHLLGSGMTGAGEVYIEPDALQHVGA